MALEAEPTPAHLAARGVPPIGAHRLLGSHGAAALVDTDAVIDWWCTPHLDSAPQLWSLLDPDGGTARWWNATGVRSIGLPAGPAARTVIDIDGELVACLDALLRLDGRPTIVRLVRSTTRRLGVTHELRAGGFDGEGATIVARSTGEGPPHRIDGSTFTSLELRPDRWDAVLLAPVDAPVAPIDLRVLTSTIERAEREARDLADASSVVTAHRDRVATALLVLDACGDPDHGALVAAPTTSLPEVVGEDRQFDYRYAWLRDASLVSSITARVGRLDITDAHLRWVQERCLACEGVPVPLTRTSGEPAPDERTIDGVAGWGGTRPVRVGNAAKDQIQIDGAGTVADAVWELFRSCGARRPAAYAAIAAVADHLADQAPGPSHGIWELREPADLASADIGRWLLFDRCRRLSLVHQPWAWRRRRRWRAAAGVARRRLTLEAHPTGAIPLVYGEDAIDGAGLLLVVTELLDRRSAAAHALVDATVARLGVGDPVEALRRYDADVDDGFGGRVGAFVPVSWMAVGALAVLGRTREAHDLADRLCRALPGLQPEVLEREPGVAGDGALGNTPLVWSHAEATRALHLLRLADLRARFGPLGVAAWRTARGVRARRRRYRRGATDDDQ